MMIVSGNFYKMLNDITFLGKKLKSFSDGWILPVIAFGELAYSGK
jgi:hypothetical protein